MIGGLFLAWEMFWNGITGRSQEAWYDRILHVIGGLLFLGMLIGGFIFLVLKNWYQ
jgi:hypothetical protein